MTPLRGTCGMATMARRAHSSAYDPVRFVRHTAHPLVCQCPNALSTLNTGYLRLLGVPDHETMAKHRILLAATWRHTVISTAAACRTGP